MDWIVGVIATIAFVIATTALFRIGNIPAEIQRKVEISLKAAIGMLRADAEENAKLLKQYSDRILEVERRVESGLSTKANTSAELTKLRADNEKLRDEAARLRVAAKKPVR